MSILIPEIVRDASHPYNGVPRDWLTDVRLSATARLALALMAGHQAGFHLNPARLRRELGICRDTWDRVSRELRTHGYLTAPSPVRDAAGRIAGSMNRLLDVRPTDVTAVTDVTEVVGGPGARDHRDPGSPGPGDVPPLNDTNLLNENTFSGEKNERHPSVPQGPVAQPPVPPSADVVPTVDEPEDKSTSDADQGPVPGTVPTPVRGTTRKRGHRVRRLFRKHWDLAQDVALHRSAGATPSDGYIIGITAVIEHGSQAYGMKPTEIAQVLKHLPQASKAELDFHVEHATDPDATETLPTPQTTAPALAVAPVVAAAAAPAAGAVPVVVWSDERVRAGCQTYAGLNPGRTPSPSLWQKWLEGLGFDPTPEQVVAAVQVVHGRPGIFTLDELADVLAGMQEQVMAS